VATLGFSEFFVFGVLLSCLGSANQPGLSCIVVG
jgi:hypothetical protein